MDFEDNAIQNVSQITHWYSKTIDLSPTKKFAHSFRRFSHTLNSSWSYRKFSSLYRIYWNGLTRENSRYTQVNIPFVHQSVVFWKITRSIFQNSLSLLCKSRYCLLAFPVDCWFPGSISVGDCIDQKELKSCFSVTKNTSIRGTTSPDQNVLHGILKYTPDENATPTSNETKRKRGWLLRGIFG